MQHGVRIVLGILGAVTAVAYYTLTFAFGFLVVGSFFWFVLQWSLLGALVPGLVGGGLALLIGWALVALADAILGPPLAPLRRELERDRGE